MEMVQAWIFINGMIYAFATMLATFGMVFWLFKFFLWLLKIRS